jgi:hypothetical protein
MPTVLLPVIGETIEALSDAVGSQNHRQSECQETRPHDDCHGPIARIYVVHTHIYFMLTSNTATPGKNKQKPAIAKRKERLGLGLLGRTCFGVRGTCSVCPTSRRGARISDLLANARSPRTGAPNIGNRSGTGRPRPLQLTGLRES